MGAVELNQEPCRPLVVIVADGKRFLKLALNAGERAPFLDKTRQLQLIVAMPARYVEAAAVANEGVLLTQ